MPSTKKIHETEFALKWRVGARTSAVIASTAARFKADIALESEGVRIDAKKMLDVLLLGPCQLRLPDGSLAVMPGDDVILRLTASGEDAQAAMAEMTELFTCGEKTLQCRNTDCLASATMVGLTRETIYYSCSKFHDWTVDRESGKMALPPFPKDLL